MTFDLGADDHWRYHYYYKILLGTIIVHYQIRAKIIIDNNRQNTVSEHKNIGMLRLGFTKMGGRNGWDGWGRQGGVGG